MSISLARDTLRDLVRRSQEDGLRVLVGLRLSGLSRYVPSALVMIAALAFSATADAQTAFSGGTQAGQMLNNICTFILGPFGQSLAVLGIIGIGMSWMFGRASLGLVAGVVGGIVIMFAAGFLGSTLTGGSTTN